LGPGSELAGIQMRAQQSDIRSMFPRLTQDRFISAAAGTPLGSFAASGIRRYMDFQELGSGNGRGEYFETMLSNVRGMFGDLIGATADEIALVHGTKAGEQIVIDGLDPLGSNRNIVTNDFHFSGSLHNLVGLRHAGVDVRIVRNRDWRISFEDMVAAIDDNTCLVAVTLLSNINGRIEPMRELAEVAHAHGAYVYADVIQAAGILPFNVRDLGIDFAAANSYKWLYGVHGSGFLYVRQELQGSVLPDSLFPGHVQFNYPPWVSRRDPQGGDFSYQPRQNATRYEPGHVSYLGFCAAYEGIRFINRIGVQAALDHSVALNRRLINGVNPDRFDCITPEVDRSPIVTLVARERLSLEPHLHSANVVVSLIGNGRIRVSPALYNTEEDIDVLTQALDEI